MAAYVPAAELNAHEDVVSTIAGLLGFGIGMLLEPMGLAAGPVVPTREWRELYAALDCQWPGAILHNDTARYDSLVHEVHFLPGSLLSDIYGYEPRRVTSIHHPVSYTHLRAHETVLDYVCRLLLEKKNHRLLFTSYG